jgi:hypothetical protein
MDRRRPSPRGLLVKSYSCYFPPVLGSLADHIVVRARSDRQARSAAADLLRLNANYASAEIYDADRRVATLVQGGWSVFPH